MHLDALGAQSDVPGSVSPMALMLVIRCCGNGVCRIEVADLLDDFSPECISDDPFIGVSAPFSDWLSDCIDVSMMRHGRLGHAFCNCRMRALCEGITEFYLW